MISINNGVPKLAHRLAWLYVYGEWPQHGLDHINGVRLDNRISNLRDVPQTINLENQRKAKGLTKSGFLGVERTRGGKWAARIVANGKRYGLGVFATPEAAHSAYVTAKRKLHEGCTI